MKYKIGDVVKIREDLQVGEKYGECEVVEDMLKYKGTTHIIKNIDFDGDYILKSMDNPADTNYYPWHKDMLEPVELKDNLKESTNVDKIKGGNNVEYKIGDVVEVRDDLKKGEKYGECEINEDMLKFKGATCTIEGIDEDGDFYLSGKYNYYAWHKDMLEPVITEDDLEPAIASKISRSTIYQYLLNHLEETYEAKNNDYGNSVADTYEKFGCVSFLVRITDKYNRLMTLCDPNAPEQRVKDEKIDDTILDLANYCILWLVEREYKNQ